MEAAQRELRLTLAIYARNPSRDPRASAYARRALGDTLVLSGRIVEGIAVRGGHHCARPLHERFGIQSSTRASFYLYTTPAEIDALVDGLDYALQFFGGKR